ncbi:unnamed protein product, partial [Rotaria sordida]
MTTAVCHCMEYYFQQLDRSIKSSQASSQQSKTSTKDPIESIFELIYLINSREKTNCDEPI